MNQSNLLLILLLSFCTLVISCKKEFTDETNIKEFEWQLQYIKDDNLKTKVPNKDYHGNSITDTDYILSFTSDTICTMSFSINHGSGNYQIKSLGEITIDVETNTKICCDNDFDSELSLMFSKIENYSVIGDYLFLEGNNASIKFKKI